MFSHKTIMRHKFHLVGAVLLATTSAVIATPTATLPFDGVAPGYSLTEPVTIHATNNLAGFQCDVLFDSRRLVCTNLPVLVSGPAGVVVDGALMAPGRYRLLAYSPTGAALTTNVFCNVMFSAITNAVSGQVPLGSGTVHFGDNTGAPITAGKVNPGLILIGTAFGFVPGSGRAQFVGATGSNYVISASPDLATWTAISTNKATNSLAWTLDTNALVLAHRFYQSIPVP
jgi:hypothetical protein